MALNNQVPTPNDNHTTEILIKCFIFSAGAFLLQQLNFFLFFFLSLSITNNEEPYMYDSSLYSIRIQLNITWS